MWAGKLDGYFICIKNGKGDIIIKSDRMVEDVKASLCKDSIVTL